MEKEIDTPAYKIFHHLFPVYIANKFLYDKKMALYQPALQIQDDEQREIYMNDTTVVYRPLAGIIMLFDQGILCKFTSNEDIYSAYQLLTDHIGRWRTLIEDQLSGAIPPPPKDFQLMKRYMEYIYEDAMFEKATVEAKLGGIDHGSHLASLFAMFGGQSTRIDRALKPASQGQSTPSRSATDLKEYWSEVDPWES